MSASVHGPVLILAVQPRCRVQSKLSKLELIQLHISFVKSQGEPQYLSLAHLKTGAEVGVGDGVGKPKTSKYVNGLSQVNPLTFKSD